MGPLHVVVRRTARMRFRSEAKGVGRALASAARRDRPEESRTGSFLRLRSTPEPSRGAFHVVVRRTASMRFRSEAKGLNGRRAPKPPREEATERSNGSPPLPVKRSNGPHRSPWDLFTWSSDVPHHGGFEPKRRGPVETSSATRPTRGYGRVPCDSAVEAHDPVYVSEGAVDAEPMACIAPASPHTSTSRG